MISSLMTGERSQDYSWFCCPFCLQYLCDSCIKTVEWLPSAQFLGPQFDKRLISLSANCVLDAVLLDSTVKFCSVALFQCCVLAFSPEDDAVLPFKMSGWDGLGVESTYSTRQHRWPFVCWWHTDCFEKKTADIISDSDFFFFSMCNMLKGPRAYLNNIWKNMFLFGVFLIHFTQTISDK